MLIVSPTKLKEEAMVVMQGCKEVLLGRSGCVFGIKLDFIEAPFWPHLTQRCSA